MQTTNESSYVSKPANTEKKSLISTVKKWYERTGRRETKRTSRSVEGGHYRWNHKDRRTHFVRVKPKPFSDIASARQRRMAIKAARKEAKAAA